MMRLALAFALSPPAALVADSHEDDRCPRRDCPVKTLMPQMLQPSEAIDERFGVPIYVKDTSKSPARFR